MQFWVKILFLVIFLKSLNSDAKSFTLTHTQFPEAISKNLPENGDEAPRLTTLKFKYVQFLFQRVQPNIFDRR